MSALDVVVHADHDSLVEAVVGRLVGLLVESGPGPDGVVLTGGRLGTAISTSLAERAWALDGRQLELWWGDERYLPIGDAERNDTGAAALVAALDGAVVRHVPGPERACAVEEAAREYAAQLDAGAPRIVTLLSLGPDGHVASLFPEHPGLRTALRPGAPSAISVHGSPKPPSTRITMTPAALSASREVWLLASGEEKAEAVRLALESGAGALQVPSAAVRGWHATRVLIDAAAASLLPGGLARPGA